MVEVELLVKIPPDKVESPVTDSVPLMVVLASVAPPTARVVAKRLVEEAVVLKKLVVVALEPVALAKVKLVRVEEALETKPLLKYQDKLSVAVVEAV